MISRIRVGLIGCGRMGTHHARVVASNPASHLVWVHDLSVDRAIELAKRHESAWKPDAPVDAVVIATPAKTHADLTREHLSLGRYCLVEKPFTADIAEAAGILDRRVSVGHIERFNPALCTVGTVFPVHIVSRRESGATDRPVDVDLVLDLLIHDLDIAAQWAKELQIRSASPVWVAEELVSIRIELDGICRTSGHSIRFDLSARRNAEYPLRSIQIFELGRYTRLDLQAGTAVRLNARSIQRTLISATAPAWPRS